jgi:Cof subfamily protein (haloacid dehalogenase superfamily)
MTIKIIAADVDGTLLDPMGKISEDTASSVKEAVKQDIAIVLTTGRPYCAIRDYMRQLEIDHPSITSGGSYILDPATSKVIADRPLSQEETAYVVGHAREVGVGIFFENPEHILHEPFPGAMALTPPTLRPLIHIVDDLLGSEPVKAYKITLVGSDARLSILHKRLTRYTEKLHITTAHATYLEVTSVGVNKGTAIQRLANYLDIPLTEVLAIGDSCNDVSMFEVVGTAIAMGNANSAVTAKAHATAPSHENGGFSWAIQEYILKKRPGDPGLQEDTQVTLSSEISKQP